MILTEGTEGDRIYKDLKEKMTRIRQQKAAQKKIDVIMDEDEAAQLDADQNDDQDSRHSMKDDKQNKILEIIEKMSMNETLDFTNQLLTFVGKRNDRSIIENLMPGLKALSVGSNAEVKKALLTQLRPLT